MVLSDSEYGPGIFTSEAWSRAGEFVSDLLGTGSSRTPAFRQWDSWVEALKLARETAVMSVLAVAIAGTGALVTVAFAASNLTQGRPAPAGPVAGRIVFGLTRASYLLTRAVPELVWALLVVFVLSPGVLAGAIALGVHNFGVLGRLGAEVVEDVDPGPVRSLRTSGASGVQALLYGVLPQVLPQFVTFLLYRWEVIIRTSVVVGLVAAAGLGYQFRLDLAFFRYTDVALLLMVYVGLVWAVDLLSIWLRHLAR
jgi:phosphonate transport system permease protein